MKEPLMPKDQRMDATTLQPRMRFRMNAIQALTRDIKPCVFKRSKARGFVPSLKNDQAMPWRQADERDLMFLLEVDPTVTRYAYRPFEITLRLPGEVKRHTPSFHVERIDGSVFVDVVRSALADRVLEATNAFFRSRRQRYEIVHPEEIRQEPRWSNVGMLLEARGMRVDQHLALEIKSAVGSGADTIAAVIDALALCHTEGTFIIRSLAARGALRLDLTGAPLSDATRILA